MAGGVSKEWTPWGREVPPWGDPAYPEAFQGAVQAAFARFYTSTAEEREADIVTSVSPRGVRVEVGPPNPGIVYVFTEEGWIDEPYSTPEDYQRWDRAMELLRSWGWTEAWWESYNPAVQFVYSEGGRVT